MNKPAPKLARQSSSEFKRWIPFIMGGLLVWGAVLGLGTYLTGGEYAVRRGLIVFVCAAIFVAFWWAVLVIGGRKNAA
ncbi:hypothetical protein NA78x_002531 [Anatilimnocola sp. NA78]|uniref:hypothetical protein n=1 Tax=Anatilimnocola sp. NA78 TaxID=3415683 RepID=UPI003CE47A15